MNEPDSLTPDEPAQRVRQRWRPSDWFTLAIAILSLFIASLAMLATAIQAYVMYETMQYPFRSAIYAKQIELTLEIVKTNLDLVDFFHTCVIRNHPHPCRIDQADKERLTKLISSFDDQVQKAEIIFSESLKGGLAGLKFEGLWVGSPDDKAASCDDVNKHITLIEKFTFVSRTYFRTREFSLEKEPDEDTFMTFRCTVPDR